MPQNETEATLLVQYDNVAGTYSYAQLSLLSVLPDSSQIEVRWDVDTVTNSSGVQFDVESLSDNDQATIKTLIENTHYTINAETKEVTIIIDPLQTYEVTVESGATYTYPPFALSVSENLQIRRATDITNQVVTFQPGSRLTSDNLNLANGQLFNALQELTVFGISSGGIVSGIDLSNSSITDLGDVNLGTSGLLTWDETSGFVTSSGDSGNLVPSTSDFDDDDDGKVVTYVSPSLPGQDVAWEFITYNDVRDPGNEATKLSSRLSSIDGRIADVEGATRDLSAEANPNDGSRFSQDLTLAEDLTVEGNAEVTGDLTVTGDIIRSGPYFWQLPPADSSDITGTNGSKTLGSSAFGFSEGTSSFQHSSANAGSDFNFDTGIWTAPRDMVISVSMTWSIKLTETAEAANSLGRVFLNGSNVGGPIYNEAPNNNHYRSATKTVVFPVTIGDEVTLVVERDGEFAFRAENAEACLHEVR